MTCVHIPYSFRKASLLNGNSAYLTSNYPEDYLESELEGNGRAKVSIEPVQDKSFVDRNSAVQYDSFSKPSKNRESKKFEDTRDSVNQGSSDNIRMDIYNIPMPRFIRGLYLSNNTASSRSLLSQFIVVSRRVNINTFVIDVQNDMIPREHVDMIKKAGIFPVARIVVFLGGLRTKVPAEGYIENILNLMDAAAHQGFLEVQLDYIRYADTTEMERVPLTFKYQTINEILRRSQQKADSLSIFLSADLFGRVTLNENDQIGQKLEHFSRYTDTIYPMLYPSHYTNDEYRISHPYETVKEGIQKSLQRCKNTRIVAYIQGFPWKIETSGKNMTNYIKAQIEAVDDAQGDGWVIWNAKNDYTESINAISGYYQKTRKKVSQSVKSKGIPEDL